jgi:hypothetical protein
MEISSEIEMVRKMEIFFCFGSSAAPKAVLEAEAASRRHLLVIPIFFPFFGTMDQISIKTPNPKCRLFLKIEQLRYLAAGVYLSEAPFPPRFLFRR